MSKYFDGELLSAYEDLNKEFECKVEIREIEDGKIDRKSK